MTVEDVSILIILQKLIDRNCSQDLYMEKGNLSYLFFHD
jgi:hypothetical protein